MATYWENSCSFGLRYVSWYKYLIVSLVFSRLGFWSGNLFLIAPFPDLCLLVPLYHSNMYLDLVPLTHQHCRLCIEFMIMHVEFLVLCTCDLLDEIVYIFPLKYPFKHAS